jgi:hypothetical protein
LHPIVFGMIAAVGRQYGMRGVRVPVEPRRSGLSPSGPAVGISCAGGARSFAPRPGQRACWSRTPFMGWRGPAA